MSNIKRLILGNGSILTAFLCLFSISVSAGNIISNGNFESGLEGWYVRNTEKPELFFDLLEDNSVTCLLCKSADIDKDATIRKVSLRLNVGKKYKLSASVKTQDFNSNYVCAVISAGWQWAQELAVEAGTNDWKDYSVIFIPKLSKNGLYEFAIKAPGRGKFWIKNILLEEQKD